MFEEKSVLVGMSGGIDSTAVCSMLLEQGYRVEGLTLITCDSGLRAAEEAAALAARLGIPHHIADVRDEFRKLVIEPFIDSYMSGSTPNPCVNCNPAVKFRLLEEWADRLGCRKIATGHYVKIKETTSSNGEPRYYIATGDDDRKDQSYFLCQLTQDQLSKALFPIGDIPKPEVRRLAAEADLPSADKKDSQGICFVGKVDLPTFLQQKLKPCEGDVVEVFDSYYQDDKQYTFIHDTLQSLLADGTSDVKMITDYISEDKAIAVSHAEMPWSLEKLASLHDEDLYRLSQPVHYDIKFETETYRSGRKHIKKTRYKENPYGKIVGKHDGAQFYTIGQRKGLNIGGHKDSIFVIETDIPKNIIYVGEGHTHKGLSRSCLRIDQSEIHWIREDLKMQIGDIRRYKVRIRYRQPLQDATLIMRENGLYILFDAPQRGITPGQFAAWYAPLENSKEASDSLHPDTCTEMIGSGVI